MQVANSYREKQKSEIAKEAFAKLGNDATHEQVDRYFQRHYGLYCEEYVYNDAKKVIAGQQEKTVPQPQVSTKTGFMSKKDAILVILNEMGINTETKKVVAEVQKRFKIEVNSKRVRTIRLEMRIQSTVKSGVNQTETVSTIEQPSTPRLTVLEEIDQSGLFSPPIQNETLSNIKAIKDLVSKNGLPLKHVKEVLGLIDRIGLKSLKLAIKELEELQISN